MKNFFAFIIVAVLATSISFAASSWNGGPATGYFKATVLCTPVLAPLADQEYNYGNVFPGDVINTPQTLTWTLTGPTGGTYTINVSGSPGSSDATWNFSSNYDDVQNIDCNAPININAVMNSVDFTGASLGSHTYTVTVSVNVTI